ncbi:MAG: hypothetical protein H0T62_07510 [Parachlamydiaceae bacterium]|nr:hypothetical protein [Parachlamydiaceae bacterium]
MNSSNNQTIDQLTVRYTKLNEKRIRAESDLKHAEDQLLKLKSDARTMWGTDDIHELDEKLQEMRKSNEKKLTDYQKHLDEIETKLKKIDEEEIAAEDKA